MERRADWTFIKLSTGRWMWRHAPEDTAASPTKSESSFAKLSQCIGDAAVHGYDPKTSLAYIFGPLAIDEVVMAKALNTQAGE
jgi:hypothetical protein